MKRICMLLSLGALLLSSCNTFSRLENQHTGKCAFYIEGELPDIGSFSAKEKVKHDNAITSVFVPSTEYKSVIPYVGKAVRYETPENDGFQASSVYLSYGFCTPDGKIISDANKNINNLYHTVTEDDFGYYYVYVSPERMDSTVTEEFMFQNQKTILIPENGQWCIELPKGSWVSGVGWGSILVQHPLEADEHGYPTKSSIRVYGYDGMLKKELFGYDNLIPAGENLFILHQYSQNDSRAVFVDVEGNTVFGPYKNADAFNKYGITAVTDVDGNSYFIKTDGTALNDKIYKNIDAVYSGGDRVAYRATHKENTAVCDIYRIDGSFLCTATGSVSYSNVFVGKEGKVVISNYHNGEYVFTNPDRSPFANSEGISPNQFTSVDGVFVNKNDETSVGTVFDFNGDNIAKLENFEYLYDVKDDAKYLVYKTGSVRFDYNEHTEQNLVVNTAKIHIYDVDNERIVCSFEGEGSGTFVGKGDRYIEISTYDAGDFFYGGSGKSFLFDTVTKKVLFSDCLDITHYNVNDKDYFSVSGKNKSTLYDEKMTKIISQYYE